MQSNPAEWPEIAHETFRYNRPSGPHSDMRRSWPAGFNRLPITPMKNTSVGFRPLLCAATVAFAFALSCFQGGATIVPGSQNLGSIWFIGDSITQGNADQDPNGYTVRSTLYNYLTAGGYNFTYTGHFTANANGLPVTGGDPSDDLYQYHSGVSGAVIGTNYETRTGITENIPIWWTNTTSRLSFVQPNVILIMIGANDANLSLDLTNAPARLSQLVATIYAQPGIGNPTILLATITPDRVSSTTISNVAYFNAAVPGVVQYWQGQGKDVYIVDNFTILNNNYATAMNSDNLHPNTLGNNYMASNWFNTIQSYVGIAAPVAPYGLTAVAGNNLVTLAWNIVPGASNSYSVGRSLTSGGPYTNIATNLATTSYADTNVVNTTTYYYVVQAENPIGASTNSNEAAATPAALPPPMVTVTVSGTQAVLNWAAVSNATGYIVSRSFVSGGPYAILATNYTTSYTNSGLTPGTTYYYVVSAFGTMGASANSTEVSASIAVLPVSSYIGDDAAEGAAITAGDSEGDTNASLTCDFVQDNGSIYTNTGLSPQTIKLTRVNYYAGSGNGSLTPFVSVYTGSQSTDSVSAATNYDVLAVGDPISVAANSGLQNQVFAVGGINPTITLNPGAVLTAGFLGSGAQIIQVATAPTGLIDYVYDGDSLPGALPNPFTADSSVDLDQTLKFNIGFAIVPAVSLASSTNPTVLGSNVTFTATISPAPTDGESITFKRGAVTLGTAPMTNGQASFNTTALPLGANSVTAVYPGDGFYGASSSGVLTQTVVSAPGTIYIGDDAAEGASPTVGASSGDTVALLTYDFVQSNGSTYTNTTAVPQTITLSQVNLYAGPNSGLLTPFLSTYAGAQTAAALSAGSNYTVLSIGDPINVSGGPGLVNQQYTVGGLIDPTVTLNPGAILTAGMETTTNLIVELNSAATGLIDYIYEGDSLPATLPNSLTANDTYSLDRTMKFDVGFTASTVGAGTIATTTTVTSSANPSNLGSNVTFTATVSPAPTNGETVVFYYGGNIVGTAGLTNGQSAVTTSSLPVGSDAITAYYGGDGLYMAGTSAGFTQTVLLGSAMLFIGDDAAEGTNITAGNSAGDSVTVLVYDFVQNNGSTYTNTTASTISVQLTKVDFYAGSKSGNITPFVSTYTGGQTTAAVSNAANYSVILIGDLIAETANSGLQNLQFTRSGTNPTVTLGPGAVLTTGFLTSSADVVELNSAHTGLIDYIHNGNDMPATLPNPFTANDTYALDRTMKFNIGFRIVPGPSATSINSSINPSTNGAPVTFTATVTPAPANGESVTFYDGATALGAAGLTNGQAGFATSALAVGSHSITAAYGGDTYLFSSTSTAITQVVVPASTNAVPLAFQAGAGQFQLSWPADHIGWQLQSQTDPPGSGIGTNWVDIPNSSLTNSLTIPMDPVNNVFFRLVYP
jgi:lysophospholipase L1-like esterase